MEAPIEMWGGKAVTDMQPIKGMLPGRLSAWGSILLATLGNNGAHASYGPPSPWDKDVGEHLLTSYHGGGLLGRQVHANSNYFQCVFYAGSNL